MGVVPSFQERQRERIRCLECTADLASGLLAAHRQVQNGTSLGHRWEDTLYTPAPRLCRLSFPKEVGLVGFPVEVCRGKASTRTNLRIHSVHCHVWYMIVIMEEGNLPHTRCPTCDFFVGRR